MERTSNSSCADYFNAKRFVSILLATLLYGTDVAAARPFATDDAGTVVQSAFEFETAADFNRETTVSDIVLKHGITNRADLGFTASYTTYPDHGSGFDALVASVKYVFVPDRIAATVTGAFDGESYCANLIYSLRYNRLDLMRIAAFWSMGCAIRRTSPTASRYSSVRNG